MGIYEDRVLPRAIDIVLGGSEFMKLRRRVVSGLEGEVLEVGLPVEYIGLDGQSLPLEDDIIDHVLVTWTLCTIPDVDAALSEMRRVLRPGGNLHFIEHGLAPQPQVAKWQDRLTPLQRRIAGGCHLNRPIEQLIEHAGFDIQEIERFYVKGPKPFGYMYRGVGVSPN